MPIPVPSSPVLQPAPRECLNPKDIQDRWGLSTRDLAQDQPNPFPLELPDPWGELCSEQLPSDTSAGWWSQWGCLAFRFTQIHKKGQVWIANLLTFVTDECVTYEVCAYVYM